MDEWMKEVKDRWEIIRKDSSIKSSVRGGFCFRESHCEKKENY
jgi:hypothetical protein